MKFGEGIVPQTQNPEMGSTTTNTLLLNPFRVLDDPASSSAGFTAGYSNYPDLSGSGFLAASLLILKQGRCMDFASSIHPDYSGALIIN